MTGNVSKIEDSLDPGIDSLITESVFSIFNEYLSLTKLFAGWMPRLHKVRYKGNRVTSSKEYMASFNCNSH